MSAIDTINAYRKAVVGFIAPATGTLIAAVQDGSDGGSAITQAEWVTAICIAVATSAGVGAIGNIDRKGKRQDESVQPPEPPAYEGEHRA